MIDEPPGPDFKRQYSLQGAGKRLKFTQEYKDFNPDKAWVTQGGRNHTVPSECAVSVVEKRFLRGPAEICLIHWQPDVDIQCEPQSPKGLLVIDRKTGETVEADERITKLSQMVPAQMWEQASRAYIEVARKLSDPYQETDPRQEPLKFLHGSRAELEKSITAAFQAFPRIFEVHHEPRVVVYSSFGRKSAGFEVRWWRPQLSSVQSIWAEERHQGDWKCSKFLSDIINTFIRENEPQGSFFVAPQGLLARRSEFVQTAQFITVDIRKPTAQQVADAREMLTRHFRAKPVRITAKLFDSSPLSPAP